MTMTTNTHCYRITHTRSISLTPDQGPPINNAVLIGAGRYTKCYRVANSKTVYLVTDPNDFSKEIATDLDPNPHLPTCTLLGCTTSNDDRMVYTMPYYPQLTAQHTRAWAQFKLLQSACEAAYNEQSDSTDHFYTYGHATIIATADRLHGELSTAVRSIADATSNYGSSWTLEIARRNCGVGPGGKRRGNLVLYDAWFDQAKVAKERTRRTRHDY